MGSPQTLTQRLVPAFVVTLVATLVLGAVVVTADVATDDAPLLPATFGIAVPQAGDAWRYNVTLQGGWTFGLDDTVRLNESVPFGTFQWGAQAKVRGGDGLLHDANAFLANSLVYQPLWIEETFDEDEPFPFPTGVFYEGRLGPAQDPYWTVANGTQWVAAGTDHIISRGEHVAFNETFTNYGFGAGVGAQWEESYFEDGYVEFPVDESPCLVFNPLQGGNVSLAAPIALFTGCRLGGEFLEVPEGLAFIATGLDTVLGVEAIRFEAHHNGTYVAWFTPSVPYPVRIEASLPSQRGNALEVGDRDLPGARSFTMDMVGFAPGNESLALVDEPTDPSPAFSLAPPTASGTHRLGPDETGLVHPFPLSEAFEAAVAMGNARFPDLQTYLGNKPEAYVSSASYREGTGIYSSPTGGSGIASEYDYVWTIGMSDGHESFIFTVAKQDYAESLPVPLRGPFNEAAAGQPVYSAHSGADSGFYFGPGYYPYGEAGRAPYPSRLPAQMPSAVSMLARWSAFDGSGTPGNSYGFTIGCDPENEDACDVVVSYVAGATRETRGAPFMHMTVPGDPYGNERVIVIERSVLFDAGGMARAMFIHDQRQYSSSAGPTSEPLRDWVPPGSPLQDPGYNVASASVSGIPSPATKWIPEPKQAAGIGFMGLVIGALYWIWPKLGVVGLFSRLHRGELLDHPARAKLVQIVESQPGIHFHDLALKAELANGTAVHHLRKLSDSGHISVRRSGRYTCYFPGGRVDPHAAAAAPLLKSEGAKQILEAVRNKPGMSNLELAQATGLQPSTVNYHVQRLSAAGLVAALRDGRNVRLHPGARAGSADPAPAAAGAA